MVPDSNRDLSFSVARNPKLGNQIGNHGDRDLLSDCIDYCVGI